MNIYDIAAQNPNTKNNLKTLDRRYYRIEIFIKFRKEYSNIFRKIIYESTIVREETVETVKLFSMHLL